MATYSFKDVKAAIVGPPAFAIVLGDGSGAAEEGLTIEQSEELNTMTIGADGSGMHSLHASRGARILVRLLKTSVTNNLLSTMVASQRQSGLLWGQNTITIGNYATGDVTTVQKVAFGRVPTINYAKEGGTIEWEFMGITSDVLLGANV